MCIFHSINGDDDENLITKHLSVNIGLIWVRWTDTQLHMKFNISMSSLDVYTWTHVPTQI